MSLPAFSQLLIPSSRAAATTATTTKSNSPGKPPTPEPVPAPIRSRQYRCSRCGQEGHNVRRCPTPHTWFRQRCGQCGGTGHNARNCPNTTTCRVCNGLGRLACSQCGGKGYDAPPEPDDDVLPLSDQQKIMAQRIRQRVRRVVGTVGDDGLVLVGSHSTTKRCKRCLGRGFLSCMACMD